MRIDHLTYFACLAESQSITQASKKLFTTHQNVSKMIRQLEDEIEAELFIRTAKGVELTKTGRIMLNFAHNTLNELQQTKNAIKDLQEQEALEGELYIYSTPLISLSALPNIINTFNQKYPKVILHLADLDVNDILKTLTISNNGVAILPILQDKQYHSIYHPYLEDLHLEPLLGDQYVCVVNSHSPFAKQKFISLSKFVQQPIILNQSTYNDHNMFIRLFKLFGEPQIAFSSSTKEIYLQALLNNPSLLGISSYRTHLKSTSPLHKQIVAIPFKESLNFDTCYVTNKNNDLAVTKAFTTFLYNHYNSIKSAKTLTIS